MALLLLPPRLRTILPLGFLLGLLLYQIDFRPGTPLGPQVRKAFPILNAKRHPTSPDQLPPQPLPPLQQHIEDVQKGCGEICRHDSWGKALLSSPHVPSLIKKVDCPALMTNAAIDASRDPRLPAPRTLPLELLDNYTYGAKVPIRDFYLASPSYSGGNARMSVWAKPMVEEWVSACRDGTLKGTYGENVTNKVFAHLQQLGLEGSRVVVIGSEIPWLEACAIAAGATHVTTIEYGRIDNQHPQITTLVPSQVRASWADHVERYDAVLTFSSVEHSGLGRYGDELNPWGDRQALARAWCMAKKGGKLALGVPAGEDRIDYNAHRVYGPVQLPHLLANWEVVARSPSLDTWDQQLFLAHKVDDF